jgi:mono/diheme cytochrome c family protein
MKRDFKFWIVLLAFSLPVCAALFIGSIYFTNCGINADCSHGFLAPIIHTPIPTLFPATLPAATLSGPIDFALTPTEAAAAGGDEVPEPSNPGLPGAAVNLKGDATAGAAIFKVHCATCHGTEGKDDVPNPGSGDGTVPPLNPIDPLLKDPDYKTFATNIDLYIQHGSVPEGPAPFRTMPGWGDKNAITQQQIADVIAYMISLNK